MKKVAVLLVLLTYAIVRRAVKQKVVLVFN